MMVGRVLFGYQTSKGDTEVYQIGEGEGHIQNMEAC